MTFGQSLVRTCKWLWRTAHRACSPRWTSTTKVRGSSAFNRTPHLSRDGNCAKRSKRTRRFGSAAGAIIITDDFDAPLPDFSPYLPEDTDK